MSDKYLHVFVNAFWCNEGGGMSGGDKRIIEILKRLEEKENLDFSVIIYAPRRFINILKDEKLGSFEYRCTNCREKAKKGLMLSYIFRTFWAIRLIPWWDSNTHCFYSTSDYFPDVIPCLIGACLNKHAQWITLVHHIIEHYKTRLGNKIINFISYYLQQFSLYLMKKKAVKVLLVSPLVQEYLVSRLGFSEDRLQRVDNGVDTVFIDSVALYNGREKQYDAIMLARLSPSKGIYDLPIIWEKVIQKNKLAKLGIIGGGAEDIKKEFIKICEQHGVIDNIDLLGFLDTESAYRYLKSAKVFVFTSREEGWGIAIAEAMACGLPVVAFELPVYKYIFPIGIKLVADRNAEEMAQYIEYLLSHSKEREKISRDVCMYVCIMIGPELRRRSIIL